MEQFHGDPVDITAFLRLQLETAILTLMILVAPIAISMFFRRLTRTGREIFLKTLVLLSLLKVIQADLVSPFAALTLALYVYLMAWTDILEMLVPFLIAYASLELETYLAELT